MPCNKFAVSEAAGREQRVGQLLVTAKDNLLLVHDTSVGKEEPIYSFRQAHGSVYALNCPVDKIFAAYVDGKQTSVRCWLATACAAIDDFRSVSTYLEGFCSACFHCVTLINS